MQHTGYSAPSAQRSSIQTRRGRNAHHHVRQEKTILEAYGGGVRSSSTMAV